MDSTEGLLMAWPHAVDSAYVRSSAISCYYWPSLSMIESLRQSYDF